MKQRIVLLEPKRHEARELIEQIEAAGEYVVSYASNLREACAIIAAESHDLALIPVVQNDSVIYSLRFLQPSLPVFLLTDKREAHIPPPQLAAAHGYIHPHDLLPELKRLLSRPKEAVVETAAASSTASPPPPSLQSDLNLDRLTLLVQNAMVGETVQLAVLLRGRDIIAYHSAADDAQVTQVAELVRSSWDGQTRTAQLQFLRTATGSDLLLYTRPLLEEYLLTLGTTTTYSLAQLRHIGDKIATRMGQGEEAAVYVPPARLVDPPNYQSYAIMWRAVSPMTPKLRLAMRDLLLSIAQVQQCTLDHLIIEPRYIHFVISCAPNRQTAWIVHTFKHQTEQVMIKQFKLKGPLWSEGYYARESTQPLGQEEIHLFVASAVDNPRPATLG